MKEEKIARRYAKALVYALSDDALLKTEVQLQFLAENYGELKPIMDNPAFSPEEKQGVISSVAKEYGFDDVLEKTLILLAHRAKASLIPELASAFSRELDLRLNRATVRVVSAKPLEERMVSVLAQALSAHIGRRVTAVTQVDPDVIAGIRVQVGGLVVDGTLAAQLSMLKQSLISYEGV